MTIDQAISALLIHDLDYLNENIAAGTDFNEVIKSIICHSYGSGLDFIASKHFGFVRYQLDSFGTELIETDVEFRERILTGLGLGDKNKSCVHSWTVYDSGWSKYEFCSKCNVKNV